VRSCFELLGDPHFGFGVGCGSGSAVGIGAGCTVASPPFFSRLIILRMRWKFFAVLLPFPETPMHASREAKKMRNPVHWKGRVRSRSGEVRDCKGNLEAKQWLAMKTDVLNPVPSRPAHQLPPLPFVPSILFGEPLRIPPRIGWCTGVDCTILAVGLLFLVARLVWKCETKAEKSRNCAAIYFSRFAI